MVMGRNSSSKGRGFKSMALYTGWTFFTYICYKNCNDVCLNRPKINDKRGHVGPFFLKKEILSIFTYVTLPSKTILKIVPNIVGTK